MGQASKTDCHIHGKPLRTQLPLSVDQMVELALCVCHGLTCPQPLNLLHRRHPDPDQLRSLAQFDILQEVHTTRHKQEHASDQGMCLK